MSPYEEDLLEVLRAADAMGPWTLSEVAFGMQRTEAQTVQELRVLERGGHIERVIDPAEPDVTYWRMAGSTVVPPRLRRRGHNDNIRIDIDPRTGA